jgi:hypothetical protein
MNLSNLLANARNIVKMGGIKALYKEAIPLLFIRKTIIIFKKDLKKIDDVKPVGDYDLKIIESEDSLLDLIHKGIRMDGFNAYDLQLRVRHGEILFMVFYGCLLVHKTSLLMRDTGTVDSPIKIDWEKEAYVQFVETGEKFRGLHIYPYVTSQVFNYARERAKAICVTSTTAENLSSIKAHLRAGYEVSGRERYSRLLLFFVFWKEEL